MKSDPANLVKMVSKVLEWLVKQRWKKIAWAAVSCLKFAAKIRARAGAAVVMQKVIKMHLARAIHKPRFEGIRDISNIRTQLGMMKETVNAIKKNAEKLQKVSSSVCSPT